MQESYKDKTANLVILLHLLAIAYLAQARIQSRLKGCDS